MVARLEELNVFACCVDIFFDNPWNNFVHHQVYLLLSRVLSTSNDGGAIVERMLQSSQLPQKLIGWERKKKKKANLEILIFCLFVQQMPLDSTKVAKLDILVMPSSYAMRF